MDIETGVRRFDFGQIQEIQRTPQGFLKIPGLITRTGVFPYVLKDGSVRRELRHPDDVFDPESMATLKNAPVTIEHPPVMLGPDNVKQYMRGYTTDRVEANRDMLESDLIIADAGAIQSVEDDGLRELSAGYVSDLEKVTGTYNGAPYTHRQRNIKYNHVAVVKKGRAGPEIRLRLDSADAIMQDEDVAPAKGAEFATESSVMNSDAEKPAETRSVAIGTEKVDLPLTAAAIVEDMLGRYDEMRGKLSQLEEQLMPPEVKPGEKKDVDTNQKGVSPTVPVVQKAPDGRDAPAKTGAGDSSGVAAAKGDADPAPGEKLPEKKADYEGAPGGVAISPVEQMKKDMEGMRSNMDAMQAKLDEYASATMNKPQGEGAGKMDSADQQTIVRARVKLERMAEKLVPVEVANRFDSLSDDEIRSAVIKHKHPKADLAGKSTVYLQSRFDSITESIDEGESVRREMGNAYLKGAHMDAADKADPKAARLKMVGDSRGLWTQPLSANKKTS